MTIVTQNNFQKCDILINELRVTSWYPYELRLLHELRVILIARVTIDCTSYELIFRYELRVNVYFTSYELLFIARITSYF